MYIPSMNFKELIWYQLWQNHSLKVIPLLIPTTVHSSPVQAVVLVYRAQVPPLSGAWLVGFYTSMVWVKQRAATAHPGRMGVEEYSFVGSLTCRVLHLDGLSKAEGSYSSSRMDGCWGVLPSHQAYILHRKKNFLTNFTFYLYLFIQNLKSNLLKKVFAAWTPANMLRIFAPE